MNLITICAKTIRACLTGGVLVGFIGGPVARPSHAATLWSTNANGTAKQFELTCGTCPNPGTVLSNLTDGGFANTSAAVEFSQADLVSYSANAVFTGPNSLPHLGASALGNIAVVAPSTFFYSASAEARATQMYTYMGGTPADYTIEYDIDGMMTGGILTELSGGFTVFGAGFNPGQEIQPVLGFSFDHVNGDGTEKPVHLTGNVTFPVNPGDIVFVQATLDAFVDSRSQQLFASADASHTLAMSFTQGDASLLIPAATTAASDVPEPASTFLAGIGGMGLLWLLARARNRQPGSIAL